jgi:hypothetical protein
MSLKSTFVKKFSAISLNLFKPFSLHDEFTPQKLREVLFHSNATATALTPTTNNSINKISSNNSSVDDTKQRKDCNPLATDTIHQYQQHHHRSFHCNEKPITTKEDRREEEEEEGNETWETAIECNCGNCPIGHLQFSHNTSDTSLIASISSSSSIDEHCDEWKSFLSITYVGPLRNYGAIIHWNVMHYHGIRGYEIHLDGNRVSLVHSPKRTSAFIENVNMNFPHHFAIAIVPNVDAKIFELSDRRMQAVYIYHPKL